MHVLDLFNDKDRNFLNGGSAISEGGMPDLNLEYQDYMKLPPMAFQSRYKMSKEAWAEKYKNLLPKPTPRDPTAGMPDAPFEGVAEGKPNLKCVCKTHGQDQCPVHAPMEEGWLKNTVAGVAIAGAALGAQARVTPDGQGGYTGGLKPAPAATQPAAGTAPARIDAPGSPSGFSKEYLQKAADPNRTGRYMISVEKAQQLLTQMQEGVAEGSLEEIDRRGFLKGMGAAAVAGAGLGAMGSAQAGGATTEYMQAYSKAKSKFEAGYDIGQVARALGVSGPNNNMIGPMGGEWGAINKAAQEMGVRNQDAPVAPPTQSQPSAEKQNPVTAEYQRLSIMALRFSLTNPKFEQEYAPIERRRNHTMDTLINGTSGKLSANPAIAQRQRIAIAQYMDDANSEYIQKTTALLKQYGALREQGVAEGIVDTVKDKYAQFKDYFDHSPEAVERKLARLRATGAEAQPGANAVAPVQQSAEDPYMILGIQPGADSNAIKLAYRRLAKQHHPDAGGNATEFQKIKAAFNELLASGAVIREGNSGAKYKMVCKDCGDVFKKPTTNCRHDSHNLNGPNWIKKTKGVAEADISRRDFLKTAGAAAVAGIGANSQAQPYQQQDLGNSFVTATATIDGITYRAIQDTISKSGYMLNHRGDGTPIVNRPGEFLVIRNGKIEARDGLAPNIIRALQKAGILTVDDSQVQTQTSPAVTHSSHRGTNQPAVTHSSRGGTNQPAVTHSSRGGIRNEATVQGLLTSYKNLLKRALGIAFGKKQNANDPMAFQRMMSKIIAPVNSSKYQAVWQEYKNNKHYYVPTPHPVKDIKNKEIMYLWSNSLAQFVSDKYPNAPIEALIQLVEALAEFGAKEAINQRQKGLGEATQQKPRVRKYTKMRPDGSKAVRYEVLDHMGRRITGQGPEGFDDPKLAKDFYYKNYDRLASLDEIVDRSVSDTPTKPDVKKANGRYWCSEEKRWKDH
jgi:hypothetical protein